MSNIFLLPFINVLDVHDAVMRNWLDGLEDDVVKEHLEYPFRLERFFPENAKFALANGNKVHDYILSLFNSIDPQAIFLNISTDIYEIENRYNKSLISPHEFWREYYENISKDISGPAGTLYKIYLNEIIEKNTRLIESKERLPLNVLFYGSDICSMDEFIQVYEEAFNMVEDFTLQMAQAANEIMNLRERPRHLWHSSLSTARIGISYEETEKFYDELLNRIKRLLKYKARGYFAKILRNKSRAYMDSYEKFLEYKLKLDEIKFSNIVEGLKILRSQSERSGIVILCEPMDYAAIMYFLKNEIDLVFSGSSGFSLQEIDLSMLFEKMKPFIQKERLMQTNYDLALNILGIEKPERFKGIGSVIYSI